MTGREKNHMQFSQVCQLINSDLIRINIATTNQLAEVLLQTRQQADQYNLKLQQGTESACSVAQDR